MNRKGFTLVEVILVIAIMSLLLLIVVPNVFILIDKNNEKSCNSLINNIESSAKMYVNDNKYDLGFDCNGKEVQIYFRDLVDSGDLVLNDKMINPVNDKEIELSNVVKVKYDCDMKDFIYEVTGIDCTNE